MHVLLTNDDGIDAPGLLALRRALDPQHRVSVVAPCRERSTTGHSATFGAPMTVRRFDHGEMGLVFAVDGFPVDCVRLGISVLLDAPVDCVISGINYGANISVVDTAQSGTVAAAREAAMCGIRAIAISQAFRSGVSTPWELTTAVARLLLPRFMSREHAGAPVWNINIPVLRPGEWPRSVIFARLATDSIPLEFGPAGASGTADALIYRGVYERRTVTPETDVAAVFGGHVSVTPITIDSTDPRFEHLAFSVQV